MDDELMCGRLWPYLLTEGSRKYSAAHAEDLFKMTTESAAALATKRVTGARPLKRSLLTLIIIIVAACVTSFASADKITPAQAKDHIGKHTTVCGVVASANFAAHAKRQPTFLYLDEPHPRHIFTAVIWIEDRPKFGKPETLKGRRVCVSGLVEDYRGKPQIVLQDAEQLRPE